MSDSAEIARFIAAPFASGVFWLMVLFFVERAPARRYPPMADRTPVLMELSLDAGGPVTLEIPVFAVSKARHAEIR
jgi:hypothetical protein